MPLCGWTMTWVEYHATFQRRQLNPGGAVAYFRDFVATFERSREPKEKMLAIDRVIHEFHYSLRALPEQPTRAAGVSLIDGNLGEVVAFLNGLSELNLPQGLRETDKVWRTRQESIQWDDILARKRDTEDYLVARAKRGSKKDFQRVLSSVPDIEADEG